MTQNDPDSESAIIKVSAKPKTPEANSKTDAMTRRDAFEAFGWFLAQITKRGLDLTDAYLEAEVVDKQADAELKLQQAADFAARCTTALATATKEEQHAIQAWLENLKRASEIEDVSTRSVAVEHVKNAAPKVNEQFEHLQYMVKRLHFEDQVSLADAPAEKPAMSDD